MTDIDIDSGETPTLDEVCKFIVDCLHKTAPTQSNGYPSIRTPNVGRGRLLLDGVNRVSESVYAEWTKRAIPEPGDLILAREAPAGNVAIIKEGQTVCLGQRTVHLRPDQEKVDPDFLCYYLLAPRQQGALLAGETGATAGHVNMRDIRRLKLSTLPAVPEQQRRGQIITAYDDLIENNRRRIALLEEAARLLYREWFVHFRFPGHEHVKITDGVPEGWAHRSVSCLADMIRGRSYRSFELADSNGQPFINLKCMRRFGGFRTSGLKWFRGEHKERHATGPGDIVIAVTDMTRDAMIVAQAARVPRSVGENAVYSMDLVKAIPKHEIEPEWLYGMFRFSGFSAAVREEATGATVLHLKPKYIENWKALVPPTVLRSLFAEQYSDILTQIDVLELQSNNCAQARDLLLPHLMNGEIAV